MFQDKLKLILLLLVLLIQNLYLFSQESGSKLIVICGYIEDSLSGERLIGTNIHNPEESAGTVSNNYGFFSIKCNPGKAYLIFSYIGYKKNEKIFTLCRDTVINIKLNPVIELEEVVIKGERTSVENIQISSVQVPLLTVKKLPVIGGETDLLKTIQMMPGIQGGMEGTSGIYVRGGSLDQNLILLDGIPVYNINHLFGVFSIFNTDAIKSATLLKGGIPAQYGGRVSSVLDIRMKEGNMKEWCGNASIGLISSKFLIEGPLNKNKTSILISGRRTYFDAFTYAYYKIRSGGNEYGGYFFNDFNIKLNHIISPKNRIFISTYAGRDKYYYNYNNKETDIYGNNLIEKDKNHIKWGNFITAIRWNYILNNKLFLNTTLTYSNYIFSVGKSSYDNIISNNESNEKNFKSAYNSGIKDIAFQLDFNYYYSLNHSFKFGIQGINHSFNPGIDIFQFSNISQVFNIDTIIGKEVLCSKEVSLYGEDEIRITPKLKLNVGIRNTTYFIDDTIYNSLEPRLLLWYLVNKNLSAKVAFTKTCQFIHLLTNSNIGLPTDLWVPATKIIKPVESFQYVFGVSQNLKGNYEMEIELFYKTFNNVIEYKENASTYEYWEQNITSGKGRSYGLELMLSKKTGKTTGWIAYTLSKADRIFNDLNSGNIFPFKYDRRHMLNLAIIHQINKRVDISLTWIYATGYNLTLGLEEYTTAISVYDNFLFIGAPAYHNSGYYSSINNFKSPAYHRLDLGVNFYKQKKHWNRVISLGLYNAYFRMNAFYLEINNGKLYKHTLFPVLPSISYKIEF